MAVVSDKAQHPEERDVADKKKAAPKKRPAAKQKASASLYEQVDRAAERDQLEFVAKPKTIDQSFTAENVEKFIMGELTWAQLMGLTRDEAFGIAAYGYQLYQEARFHDARTVFEALVLGNPYESYFHNMLGAVYQQLDLHTEALSQFTRAVECDEEAVHPRINRGEIFLKEGRFEEALEDFTIAVATDKTGKDPGLDRARMMAKAAQAVMQSLNLATRKKTGATARTKKG